MSKNPLFKLAELGQSVWYDDISRTLVRGDGLQRLIDDRAVVGVTTNPSIFEKAIGQGDAYDEDLIRLARKGASPEDIFMDLALDDVSRALDTLRPAYESTSHLDGRVSMEVLASLAHDTYATQDMEVLASLAHETYATQDMVRDIWRRVDKPNLMVKIPATDAGIPAIEEMLYEGHNINITLIFGLDYYRRVAEAYVNAVERRVNEGKPVEDLGSVASFFVSRVDTKVDKQLDDKVAAGDITADDAKRLKGRAAVANAKLAYEMYGQIFKSERFKPLQAKGARVQRCLWASTSTKNPEYPDVMYVEDLIGPDTVNTIPGATLEAYVDHGHPADRIEEGLDEAKALMGQLEEVGIDMQKVTDELIDEGVKSFEAAFEKLLDSIRQKAGGVIAGS